MAEGSAGVVGHRDKRRTGQIEAQSPPPPGSATLGVPCTTHGFLLDFDGKTPPIRSLRDHRKELLFSRAKVHNCRSWILQASDSFSQSLPRLEGCTSVEQAGLPILPIRAPVCRIREIDNSTVPVSDEQGALSELRGTIVHRVHLKTVHVIDMGKSPQILGEQSDDGARLLVVRQWWAALLGASRQSGGDGSQRTADPGRSP